MNKIYNEHSLNENTIKSLLNTEYIGRDFYFFEEVTSTFNESEKITLQNGTVICAAKQTNGRGRLGRQWQSDKGGIYFSLILTNDIIDSEIQMITSLCAVAIQRAISKYLPCMIKWPNDIVSENGKKLCGILTKLKKTDNRYIVNVGIGINANTEHFDKDLKYATSIYTITGRYIDENELLCSCLKELEYCIDKSNRNNTIEEYKKCSATLGRRVRLLYVNGKESDTGLCTAIENDGTLTVLKDDGTVVNVSSGEVSVRGIYGEQYA